MEFLGGFIVGSIVSPIAIVLVMVVLFLNNTSRPFGG